MVGVVSGNLESPKEGRDGQLLEIPKEFWSFYTDISINLEIRFKPLN